MGDAKNDTQKTPPEPVLDQIRIQEFLLVQTTGEGAGTEYPLPMGDLVIGAGSDCDIRITELSVSRKHCRISRSADSLKIVDLGSTNGTLVDAVVIESAFLKAGSVIRCGAVSFGVQVSYGPLATERGRRGGFRGMVGQSRRMSEVFSAREQLASSDVTILIQGETGTGKSMLARSIHQASARRTSPFIVFDCASIAPTLIEAQLFGHEKGAFTGATSQRSGAFELAGKGTLFLDELTELPLELQSKLLRALEEREFSRLGSSAPLSVKCRIIAASQHDLWALTSTGKFRRDLYFRLAVVTVPLPTLAERKDDLPLIVEQMLAELGSDAKGFGGLPLEMQKWIQDYDWPGNIRELRNYLERWTVMPGDVGHPNAVRSADEKGIFRHTMSIDVRTPYRDSKQAILDVFEKNYLQTLLNECAGNVSEASRRSGLNRQHLSEMALKHGLSRGSKPGQF